MPDADAVIRKFAESQYGVVAAWQLYASGLRQGEIRSRVRSRRLILLHTSVFAVGHCALSQRGLWVASALAAGPGALLSHQSAAALWGFATPGSTVHVIGSTARFHPPGPGRRFSPTRIHRTNSIHEEDRCTRHGIPVTSVPRTFSDVAGTESDRSLAIMFNEATRTGLMDISAMRRLLLRTTGKRGGARLERLVRRWHPLHRLTKSEMEDLFLELCRLAGFPKPLVNRWVLGMQVDFWWPELGLIVELDSREFHEDDRGHEEDRIRTARLELAGYRVLRLTWAMVTDDPQETTLKVREYFQLAATTSTAKIDLARSGAS